MVRNLIVEIELAEPAVSKVQRHFLAQTALMANSIAVTDQKHPDHQFGIDRGPADVAVKRLYRPSRPLAFALRVGLV